MTVGKMTVDKMTVTKIMVHIKAVDKRAAMTLSANLLTCQALFTK